MAAEQPLRARQHRRSNDSIHDLLHNYVHNDKVDHDHDEVEQVLREGGQVLVAEEGEEADHARAGSGQGWDSEACLWIHCVYLWTPLKILERLEDT